MQIQFGPSWVSVQFYFRRVRFRFESERSSLGSVQVISGLHQIQFGSSLIQHRFSSDSIHFSSGSVYVQFRLSTIECRFSSDPFQFNSSLIQFISFQFCLGLIQFTFNLVQVRL